MGERGQAIRRALRELEATLLTHPRLRRLMTLGRQCPACQKAEVLPIHATEQFRCMECGHLWPMG